MSAQTMVKEAINQMKDKNFNPEAFVQDCINKGYVIMTSSEIADEFELVETDLGDVVNEADDFAKLYVPCDHDYDYDNKWCSNDDEVREAEDEAKEEACKYASTLDPVLIIDKSCDIGILPVYKDGDKYLSEKEVEEKILSLVPKECEITIYGDRIDYGYYEPPEWEEAEIMVSVECDNLFIDDMTSAVAMDVAEYKNHDISKLLSDKIKTDIDRTDS